MVNVFMKNICIFSFHERDRFLFWLWLRGYMTNLQRLMFEIRHLSINLNIIKKLTLLKPAIFISKNFKSLQVWNTSTAHNRLQPPPGLQNPFIPRALLSWNWLVIIKQFMNVRNHKRLVVVSTLVNTKQRPFSPKRDVISFFCLCLYYTFSLIDHPFA